MTFLRAYSYDAGRVMAAANAGDTLALTQVPTIVNNAASQVLTGSAIAGQVILRQGAGAVSDVTDTGAAIMQALYGNTGSEPKVGESFDCRVSNQGASTVTITGGVGVTVSGNTAILANLPKTLLFICTAPGVKTYSAGVYTNVGATFNCICL